MKKIFLTCVLLTLFNNVFSQKNVTKTNTQPVLMHYMPWFDTPQTSGFGGWGWHWTMNNRNPDNVDAGTGKRDIASHYYPLIGPYASNDPHVLEYHLLLMKLSGIDGIFIDWYGKNGSNADISNLLRNSNTIVAACEKFGMKFSVVLEDRFATSVEDSKKNITYLHDNYFNKSNYLRVNGDPLVAVFGPITFQKPEQWTEILSGSSSGIEFLPLWHEARDAGNNADGEYAWVWEDENLNNYFTNLENYYRNNAPSLKTVMGVAYPGFMDFYKEGNAGPGYFEIEHNDGETLEKTLALANKYKADLDILQLATWNDYGEGTIFEPTMETGFNYLQKIQSYTGVKYTITELLLVYRLYNLRKLHQDDDSKNILLDQVSSHLNNLELSEAKSILDGMEILTNVDQNTVNHLKLEVYPNPMVDSVLNIQVNIKEYTKGLKVFVSDLLGHSILDQEIQNAETIIAIPRNKLSKGVYIVTIQLTGKIITSRIAIVE